MLGQVTYEDDQSVSGYCKGSALKGRPFAKGDIVKHTARGRIGMISFGPDSDQDFKVTFDDDGSESGYVKADGLVEVAFRKGDFVYHGAEKRYGVIVYGPDRDFEYKVKYEDNATTSVYLKGTALRGGFAEEVRPLPSLPYHDVVTCF